MLLGEEKNRRKERAASRRKDRAPLVDDVTFHTFNDWHQWNSPSELLAAHPDGWALLAGGLASSSDGSATTCSVGGCGDAVVLEGVGRGAMLEAIPG